MYEGYRVLKMVPLPELNSLLIELVHEKSGALIIHIGNDDPENLFCLSFQTLPSSSNGVAHILEHTVLCGSKKYPIKDPFFAMQRRSLNTFMNALTGADFTCYPASTQVKHDFYNLLDVYIDAVFSPTLNENSFRQEGHRIEFENPEDPTTPLTIRGIVFNEMQGSMNSPSMRLHEAMFQALYPDVTYGVNSGGDPLHIPNLSYQELLNFHQTYYHPSRCLFFFYGNIPLNEHLEYLEKRILNKVEKAAPLPKIPLQQRFQHPKRLETRYSVLDQEASEDKAWISFGWLTCHVLNQDTCLAINILEMLLLETDASPLKKALMKSGFCKQVSSYVDTEMNEVPFIIYLKGCTPDSADAIEVLVMKTLESIVLTGFTPESIENAIHQIEFHRSEIGGDHHPFGLNLFMRAGLLRQHGGDSEQGLLVHSLCDTLRARIKKNPRLFTDLIQKYFIDNPHFVRMVMKPDPKLDEEDKQNLKKHLLKIEASLKKADKEAIVEKALELKAFQDAQEEENIDILPKVTLKDVPKKGQDFPLKKEKIGNLTVYHHNCFTNKIGYADLFLDLPPLDKKELQLTRLLSIILTQIGAGPRTYEQNLEYIQENTGGVSPYLTLHMHVDNPDQFRPAFALRGKALYRKLDKLFPLMNDYLKTPHFHDIGRLKEILVKHNANLESGLAQSALKYAINLSSSTLDHPSALANIWYGLDYYNYVKQLMKNWDTESHSLTEDLTLLMKKIISNNPLNLILSLDEEEYQKIRKNQFDELSELTKDCHPTAWNSSGITIPDIESQARLIPSPVAFIAKVFKTIPYIHEDSAALSLASCLFDHLTLHRKIREEGGAYGGGAVSNALSGNFYFFSYRDPKIMNTLNAFEQAMQRIIAGDFDDEDLEAAKLEMVQHLDSPVAPGSRAVVAYNWLEEGRDFKAREHYRKQLLEASKETLIAAVKTHLLPQFPSGKEVIFAGRELIEKENHLLIHQHKQPLPIYSI